MSILASAIAGKTVVGSALDFAGGLLDRIWPKQASMDDKMKAIAQIAPLIENRDNEIVSDQKDIIMSEMAQGDNYTKRARPTVVYAGLAFIGIVNVLIPSIIKIILAGWILFGDPAEMIKVKSAMKELDSLTSLQLPGEFWFAWSSVVGIWAIGRSAEKRGVANKIVEMITGSKK